MTHSRGSARRCLQEGLLGNTAVNRRSGTVLSAPGCRSGAAAAALPAAAWVFLEALACSGDRGAGCACCVY